MSLRGLKEREKDGLLALKKDEYPFVLIILVCKHEGKGNLTILWQILDKAESVQWDHWPSV